MTTKAGKLNLENTVNSVFSILANRDSQEFTAWTPANYPFMGKKG